MKRREYIINSGLSIPLLAVDHKENVFTHLPFLSSFHLVLPSWVFIALSNNTFNFDEWQKVWDKRDKFSCSIIQNVIKHGVLYFSVVFREIIRRVKPNWKECSQKTCSLAKETTHRDPHQWGKTSFGTSLRVCL